MKVLIDGIEFFDSTKSIISIKLSKEDKDNISNMDPEAFIYCSFPEDIDIMQAQSNINILKEMTK